MSSLQTPSSARCNFNSNRSLFFFILALVLLAAGFYLVYRFHKIDKRWGNKYKIACGIICIDLLGSFRSRVYVVQQLAGHNVTVITSVMGFVNRATLVMSYMFFLNSLLDILEMTASNKNRILRLGLYLLLLYLVETVVEINYSRFCTGTGNLIRIPDDYCSHFAQHHVHLVHRFRYCRLKQATSSQGGRWIGSKNT